MPSLHLVPSVGVEVERKGFAEEQDDVKNHRRPEYAAEFAHHLRIAPYQDENQDTAEECCR